MKKQDILDCMNYVDADLIEAADLLPPQKQHPRTVRRWIAAAACLVLVIGSCFGVHVYAAEQREYKAAVSFFEANNLSTEGLTRGEIKAVYRDITTEQFTYSKTAEVLQASLQAQIPGYEILHKEPTPEEIESLWTYQNGYRHLVIPDQADYKTELVEFTDPDTGVSNFQKSVISRYEAGECLWQTDIDTFEVLEYRELSHGLLVWGFTPSDTGMDYQAAMAKLDPEGNLLWERILNNGFGDEYIGAIAENPDGSIAVFSRGDLQYLCISQYGADGEYLSFQKHPVGNYGIWNATRLGEDYLVQLGNGRLEDKQKLVRITQSGEMTDSFRYTAEDRSYYITDLQEFNGNLYISAYTTPKTPEGHHELLSIVKDYEDLIDMPETELTKLVRETYQAVLLICEPNGGMPQEFYSVPGNLGGELNVDANNRLIWQTEDIQGVYYSPATSSFTFKGISEIYEYAFSPDGVLESCTETGKQTYFRK